jgi:organic radical activating enzyme
MTPARVAAGVRRLRKGWPADWVDLTGGEPMLQNLGPLVRRLRAEGLAVQVETNGTVFCPEAFDWISVSPKPPGYAYDPRLRRRAREVKLVVSRELSFPILSRLRVEFPSRVPIFLQPESNVAWSRAKAARLFHRAIRDGLPNVRLGVQLHKLYGLL